MLPISDALAVGRPSGQGNNVGYPARYESVIAVASSRDDDTRSDFSSTGPAVELIAPGERILSTIPNNNYGILSGTSMASPHVAGVAALVWAANPVLSNTDIRQILRDTAEDLGLSSNQQGFGLVRADLAVAAVSVIVPPATGNIDGKVTARDGTAIEGATVFVESTSSSASTDLQGYYFLENVMAGEREVTAKADGYNPETLTVTVIENALVNQDFTLTVQEPGGLSIDRFDLTDTSNPQFARVRVTWEVSGENLSTVKVDIAGEGNSDSQTWNVSGSNASGEHEFSFRRGFGSYSVTLTAADANGTIPESKQIQL